MSFTGAVAKIASILSEIASALDEETDALNPGYSCQCKTCVVARRAIEAAR